MKPSTIQNVKGKNDEILTQLVREHRELIDLCKDFAQGVCAGEIVDQKYV